MNLDLGMNGMLYFMYVNQRYMGWIEVKAFLYMTVLLLLHMV